MEEWKEELQEAVASAVEDAMDEAVEDLDEKVQAAVDAYLREFSFRLPDGTLVQPRDRLRILAPDQTKLLSCFGGLRVEDTSLYSGNCIPKGWGLAVETANRYWEILYVYERKEDAVRALQKVAEAIQNGDTLVKL